LALLEPLNLVLAEATARALLAVSNLDEAYLACPNVA
jgi:hypothetical protein